MLEGSVCFKFVVCGFLKPSKLFFFPLVVIGTTQNSLAEYPQREVR